MNKKIVFYSVLYSIFLFAWTPSGNSQPFVFDVKHDHGWGACAGKLGITEEGIEYATEKENHRRRWKYQDLKLIEISSRKELVLHTYEDVRIRPAYERQFEFKLQEGEISAETYRYLRSKATRPLVTHVTYPMASYTFSLPVKHRHLVGGCEGELKASEEQIVYETNSKDARIWLYRDVTGIGLMDPYSLRITTLLENFTFDLKAPMSQKQYEFLWAKVYQLEGVYTNR